MKHVTRVIHSLVLTGVYGTSLLFWILVVKAISESSLSGAILISVLLAATVCVAFLTLKEGGASDETKAEQ